MILRCYNCGIQGHKTQHCPSYGPRYPAPGKTTADYEGEKARILRLFAADILAEHEPNESDYDGLPSRLGARKYSARELAARQFPCRTCGSPVGQACRTKAGKQCACHRDRYHQIHAVEMSNGNQ